MAHIIQRTEKVRQLKSLLEETRVVYISSFFYSGKTVLLGQLADSLRGQVLRFDAEKDAWDAFVGRAAALTSGTLLIDGLHRLPEEAADPLTALLCGLPEGVGAVLAGRAQQPAYLNRLCAGSGAAILDKDFVMFTEDEIEQLLLDYGIPATPADIAFLKEAYWGNAFTLHIAARLALRAPGRPLRAMRDEVLREMGRVLVSDVVLAFPQPERALLHNLSPFDRFTEDMARMVTGRTDAPRLMRRIAWESYMLTHDGADVYSFVPLVRRTLFDELKNQYSQDYIDNLYKRAALYYELQNQVPRAIGFYMQLGDREKIRELLIRDTHNRPVSGDNVELRAAYAMLPEEAICASPELMKGMCLIESFRGQPEESERWYQRLKQYVRDTSPRDYSRRTAEEAVAYLDIVLPHRGTRRTLGLLVAAARMRSLTQSRFWEDGFNVAGNSVSLLNGGLDFSRWVPHGWRLYRVLKTPIEAALGRGGSGVGDIAIGECELESNLTGDYALALDKVCAGLARTGGDLELRCAAVGVQSRIVAAQGNAAEAGAMIDHLLQSLPEQAPARLRQNLTVHRLTLDLMAGDAQPALGWLSTDAPDETGDFIVMDRYAYLLKLRLYIVTARWQETALLTAKLRHYLDTYDRPYMRVQLHLMQALIDRRTGGDGWRGELEGALALAKRYRLARVIADEGIAVVDMLNELSLPDGPWERGVLRLTRAQAARYPNHMKQAAEKPVFTDREYQVYSLMIAGYKNAKIAAILNITERTVKHYTSEIYRKLNVTTRSEALARAAELGDMR